MLNGAATTRWRSRAPTSTRSRPCRPRRSRSRPDPIALKRAEIGALADEQPDEIADLLRGWLTESGGVRR